MKIEIITYNDDNIETHREIKYLCSQCGEQVSHEQLLRPFIKYELKNRPLRADEISEDMYKNDFVHIGEIRGRACISCIEIMKQNK